MATTLAAQLAAVSTARGGDGAAPKRQKGKASLLFDALKAADVDQQTIYGIGVQGARGGCAQPLPRRAPPAAARRPRAAARPARRAGCRLSRARRAAARPPRGAAAPAAAARAAARPPRAPPAARAADRASGAASGCT